MTFPDPVIHVAIEPKTKSDQEKLGIAIQKLSEEDPTFTVRLDEETGQTVIGGMGELHLDVFVDRMRREFKVEANVGNPMVAYRETIRKKVDKVEYTHKKQTGGLDLELAAHAVHEHVQVELAHTADNGLAGLLIEGDGEGGVLLGELLDGHTQLSWSPLVLGSIATWMTGSGKLMDSRMIGESVGAQGVTGGDVLEAG